MNNLLKRTLVVLVAVVALVWAAPSAVAADDKPICRIAVVSSPYITSLPAKDIREVSRTGKPGKSRSYVKDRGTKNFNRAIETANTLKVDATVVMGSLTWRGVNDDFAEFKTFLKKIKGPVYLQPGVRDLKNSEEAFEKALGEYNAKIRSSVNVNGVLLQLATLTNSRDPKAQRATVDWLEQNTSAVKSAKAVLLFGGLSETKPGSTKLSKRYWNIIQQQKIAARISSAHSHALYYTEIMPTWAVPSSGWSGGSAVAVVSVYRKRIELSLIPALDQPAQTLTVPNPVNAPRLAPTAKDPHQMPSLTEDIATKPELTFVHLSDSQFDDMTNKRYASRFSSVIDLNTNAVKQANRIKPAFVLMTGDLVNKGTLAEWKTFNDIYSKLEAPLYTVSGNHDTTRAGQDQMIPADAKEFAGPVSMYRYQTRNFASKGRRYYSFEKNGVVVIALDTATYDVDAEQMTWLEKELERTKAAKHVFILGHMPLYKPWGHEIKQGRTEILALMKKYKVAGYLFGHRHSYRYRMEDGSAHLMCDCLCWGSSRSYWIVHVYADKIVACWKPIYKTEGSRGLYERVVFPEPRYNK